MASKSIVATTEKNDGNSIPTLAAKRSTLAKTMGIGAIEAMIIRRLCSGGLLRAATAKAIQIANVPIPMTSMPVIGPGSGLRATATKAVGTVPRARHAFRLQGKGQRDPCATSLTELREKGTSGPSWLRGAVYVGTGSDPRASVLAGRRQLPNRYIEIYLISYLDLH